MSGISEAGAPSVSSQPLSPGGAIAPDFRLIHFSIQGNHIHLLVEAADADQLASGLQGLAVRIARRLNRMMGRTGKVFADRYHAHALTSPAEVASAIRYVLGNFVIHALRRGEPVSVATQDEYSSAFTTTTGPPLVAPPETWLLRVGWRRARTRAAQAPADVQLPPDSGRDKLVA